jgi:hypothetical protein
LDQVAQVRGGRCNVDAMYALALLERDLRAMLVFFGHRGGAFARVVNDEREGRRVAQHGFYGRAVGADEVEVQVVRAGEYDEPPEPTYMD